MSEDSVRDNGSDKPTDNRPPEQASASPIGRDEAAPDNMGEWGHLKKDLSELKVKTKKKMFGHVAKVDAATLEQEIGEGLAIELQETTPVQQALTRKTDRRILNSWWLPNVKANAGKLDPYRLDEIGGKLEAAKNRDLLKVKLEQLGDKTRSKIKGLVEQSNTEQNLAAVVKVVNDRISAKGAAAIEIAFSEDDDDVVDNLVRNVVKPAINKLLGDIKNGKGTIGDLKNALTNQIRMGKKEENMIFTSESQDELAKMAPLGIMVPLFAEEVGTQLWRSIENVVLHAPGVGEGGFFTPGKQAVKWSDRFEDGMLQVLWSQPFSTKDEKNPSLTIGDKIHSYFVAEGAPGRRAIEDRDALLQVGGKPNRGFQDMRADMLSELVSHGILKRKIGTMNDLSPHIDKLFGKDSSDSIRIKRDLTALLRQACKVEKQGQDQVVAR